MSNKVKKENLETCKEFCNKIIKVCEDIENGEFTRNACENNGVDVRQFRYILSKTMDGEHYVDKDSKLPSNFLKTPQEKFLSDLFEEDNWFYVPDDFDEAIKITFSSLKDREREVLTKYYFEEMSMPDIGKYYGVCTQRIGQLIHKSLRKLRCPNRIAYFQDGVKYTCSSKGLSAREIGFIEQRERLLSILEKCRSNSEDLKISDLNLSCDLTNKLNLEGFSTFRDIFSNTNRFRDLGLTRDELNEFYFKIYNENKDSLECIPIEILGLSNRINNALLRGNIKTLNDLRNIGLDNLTRVRNIGKSTVIEIAVKLEKLGVKL